MSAADRPVHLGILIFPGFPLACLTSCIEPLRGANEISGTEAFKWSVVAETLDPVPSSAGVSFSPDQTLSELDQLDHLLLTAEPNSTFSNPSKANATLQRFLRNGSTLGSISGGVFPLARTGLTGDQPLSVHWCYETAFRTEFPNIPVRSNVINSEGAFTTISGASAAFDHMLALIEARLGVNVMTQVACWFQHPFIRSEAVLQKVPDQSSGKSLDLMPKPIEKAIRLFAEHIENPLQMNEVAAAIGMSTRTLERSFKRATGKGPLAYYRKMRMDQARQLVLYSNEPVSQVGYMVGFSAPSTFMRHYRETFGITPINDRLEKNSLRVKNGDALPSG